MFVTSYNEEFKWPKPTSWGIKKWPKDKTLKSEDKQNLPPVYRNSETLTQLTRECLTPFNYLLQPKPIVQTNPLVPFSVTELPKDDGNARLSRPRVYKAPEISLDDIEDLDTREKIIDYTYSTTWGLASMDAAARTTKRQVSNSTWELPYHVQFSKKAEVSYGLDCKTEVTDAKLNEWDRCQSRALVDPTTDFWQHYRTETPVKLFDQATTDMKSPEFTNHIINLASEERLRLPYMLKPADYAGFMPDSPIGIKPEKEQLEISDPMLTVYQLANRWRGQ